jgi:hypothetical protein
VSDQKQGYGRPAIHGYNATLTGGLQKAAMLASPLAGQPVVKITLHGEGFIQRAMPLIIRIGDQVVLDNCEITDDQRTLTLHLEKLPEDGAVIQVGYGGDEMVELSERFSHSKLEGGGAPNS